MDLNVVGPQEIIHILEAEKIRNGTHLHVVTSLRRQFSNAQGHCFLTMDVHHDRVTIT